MTRNCSILNPVCRSGLVCEEPQSEDDFDSVSCVVATSCEELECDPGMFCREFTFNNGDVSGSGSGLVTATSPTLQTVARCVSSGLLPASCDDIECEEDQVCILQIYPSRSISLASCNSRSLIPPTVRSTQGWRHVLGLVSFVWIWSRVTTRCHSAVFKPIATVKDPDLGPYALLLVPAVFQHQDHFQRGGLTVYVFRLRSDLSLELLVGIVMNHVRMD